MNVAVRHSSFSTVKGWLEKGREGERIYDGTIYYDTGGGSHHYSYPGRGEYSISGNTITGYIINGGTNARDDYTGTVNADGSITLISTESDGTTKNEELIKIE